MAGEGRTPKGSTDPNPGNLPKPGDQHDTWLATEERVGAVERAAGEAERERIIIELLERHYSSLSTLEQELTNLEVKLESVTKKSGIRGDGPTKESPLSPDGWDDDSSQTTKSIGEIGQRIIALSGRIASLTEHLET